jgi:mannose-6-phosphate isomerase-like protein (cupin superfamily)
MGRRVDKPWGHEDIWAETERYVGKVLAIDGGKRLSLQYHEHKDESILVLRGRLCLELENGAGEIESMELQVGESRRIAPGRRHRFAALDGGCELVEVSTPDLEDVVRVEDDYGRTP